MRKVTAILTLSIISLFLTHVYAETRIDVANIGHQKGDPVKKTIAVVPQVSYEGTEFCVSVPLAIEGISVSIVDADSFAVYNGVSPIASKTHRFTVGSLNDGELYTIYVTIGSCVWTGDFIFTL